MATFRYDDKNLQRLYGELDEKHRLKALRGAFRKEANRVRKEAIKNLRGSGIRTDKDLEKGVRSVVPRKRLGFGVTVGTKGSKKKGVTAGVHTNRRGLKKPILIWAEDGTKQRKTKGRKDRKGHSTGRMKRYGFMAKTRAAVVGKVEAELREEVANYVIKTAKKYGCT